MKLTDKDLLEDALQGAINIMKANGIDMISPRVPLAIIKGAPTIEAIPVKWLKSKHKESLHEGMRPDEVEAVEMVLWMWQKEQEVKRNG